jgi:hypothetical protein
MEWRWLRLPPSVGSIWHLMAVRGSILGRKQEDAIAALLTQRNVEEAARAAGIGVRTLLRWLKLPEFQSAYRQARRDAFGQAIARLQQGTSAAATVDGIVTVSVTGEPMYNSTNGIFSAVILSTTGHICQ